MVGEGVGGVRVEVGGVTCGEYENLQHQCFSSHSLVAARGG